MGTYIVCTVISIFFAYIANAMNSENSIIKIINGNPRVAMVLSALPLTIIAVCRYEVGTDYFSYYRTFFNHDLKNIEVGFVFLIDLLNELSSNPQIFFAITAMFVGISFYMTIYKESKNYALSVLLFVITQSYFASLNVVRQFIPICIMLYIIPFIKKKRIIRVVIATIIGSLFHETAFVILLIYLFYVLPIIPFFSVIIFAVFVGTGELLRTFLYPIIIEYTRFGNYLFSDYYKIGDINNTYLTLYMIIFTILCLFFNKYKYDDSYKLLYSAIQVGILLVLSAVVMPSNVSRLIYYSDALLIVLFPTFLDKIEDRKIKSVLCIIVIIIYATTSIPSTLRGNHSVIPYQAFWSRSL